MADIFPVTPSHAVSGVFIYEGTDAVAEGEPFVLDTTKGDPYIDRPKAQNGIFVGVAARGYPADKGARQIELNIPGSLGVKILVGATVAAGAVVQYGYTASTGAKIFKAAQSAHALTALQVGDAIVREAKTVSSGTAAVLADLPVAPYAAGVSV